MFFLVSPRLQKTWLLISYCHWQELLGFVPPFGKSFGGISSRTLLLTGVTRLYSFEGLSERTFRIMAGSGGPVATFSVWDYVVFAGLILLLRASACSKPSVDARRLAVMSFSWAAVRWAQCLWLCPSRLVLCQASLLLALLQRRICTVHHTGSSSSPIPSCPSSALNSSCLCFTGWASPAHTR